MASPRLRGVNAVSVQLQDTCFGCGRDNPHGLQVKFRIDSEGAASAIWVPDTKWEGLKGIVHGGILATLLDEAMAKAVAAKGYNMMTADLRVRFRKYAQSCQVLEIRGWIVRCRKRLIETEATIVAPDGSECAHAWAAYLALKTVDGVAGTGANGPPGAAAKQTTGE